MVERRTIPLVPSRDDDCNFANARPGVSTRVRALQLACLVLGGLEPLARHLNISPEALLAWLQGQEDPPDHVFLAAVEVLVLDAERNLLRA